MNTELVSIIIPVYNREYLILETLASIQNQSYQNWECILIDDGSTDNTISIVNKFIANIDQFKLYRRPDNRLKGANSCRNYGFELSKGKYINWFDSDDLMHENFIKNKINAFKDVTDCIISKTIFFKHTISQIVGKETRTNLSDNLIEDFVMLKSSWYLPDPMWKKTFLLNKNLFSDELKKGQDRDFHTRMLLHKPNIIIIDAYLTYYRQHNITISMNYSSNVVLSYFNNYNKNIHLLSKEKISNQLKFFLLKSQIKNYPYLYQQKNSFKTFLKVFQKLFVFDLKNIFMFLKFITAIILFKLIGKGSFLLKD